MTSASVPGSEDTPATVRFALTGAAGVFARTLLMQARHTPGLRPTVLCDLDPVALRLILIELGYPGSVLTDCTTVDQVRQAVAADRLAIITDFALLERACYDILVEATGAVGPSYRAARAALEAGRHVAMISKETDSVAGPALAALTRSRSVVYTTAAGDQPANLIELINWARMLGLIIIAAGKSSEYDVIWDDGNGRVTHHGVSYPVTGLAVRTEPEDRLTDLLDRRAAALSELPLTSAADYCELGVVANSTGLLPDTPRLHYPVARINELADVYALRADGGLIERPGTLDVFTMLRRADEASFAGGVFVVVRCEDGPAWQLLAGKGHVVSRDGRYACIYQPFHLMGVETPGTLLAAVRGRSVSAPGQRVEAVLVARAAAALQPGTPLQATGHHHEIAGVAAELIAVAAAPPDAVPYYLASGGSLRRPVRPGSLLTFDDVDGLDPELIEAWRLSRTGSGLSVG